MKKQLNLPTPDPDALQRSETLRERIVRAIRQNGPMPFSEYMQRALYTPGLGYYSNGLPKLGPTGDFTTAPESSPLFGQCVARQLDQILGALGGGNILEFGAGSGRMARDILLTLADADALPERYQILDLSADLRARQQAFLQESLPPELYARVEWLERLPAPGWRGVVVANEVLDAMPVERFYLEPGTSWRMGVDADESGQLIWTQLPISDATLQRVVNGLRSLIKPTSLGYKAEVNLNIHPWLKSLSDFMAAGAVLLIDYGFPQQELYQKERLNGTLRCFYQHRVHDNPLLWPGLQDITAHVDFTEVAESGFDAGFRVAGFTTQAHFLMSTGLLESIPADLPVTEQLKLSQQIKTLTLPDEMGEIFKVMALTKGVDTPLMGFQLVDLRDRL
ncbi:SAM-dependent methyltransferase, MidA family [Sulfurivirga caldicuralii]|uniref:SAM-dependent methyltransferase, MidA family n=1 Tax=Sulfurivirga caldicuralii TaxID=364032 RepID=A0A1N6GS46_9GAMM|nr:SAM-dependent methyltransferase [Sulfurivirga caldicuralii]SIO10401.1 SAM-dependent methyltransferase, MidA family [Sulfurivirga caldicuralii]